MFSAASVCLFVCQHDNFRTTKHRMMKLGGKCVVQKSRPSSNLVVIAPPRVHTPKMCGWATTVEKISAGCLVLLFILFFVRDRWHRPKIRYSLRATKRLNY